MCIEKKDLLIQQIFFLPFALNNLIHKHFAFVKRGDITVKDEKDVMQSQFKVINVNVSCFLKN